SLSKGVGAIQGRTATVFPAQRAPSSPATKPGEFGWSRPTTLPSTPASCAATAAARRSSAAYARVSRGETTARAPGWRAAAARTAAIIALSFMSTRREGYQSDGAGDRGAGAARLAQVAGQRPPGTERRMPLPPSPEAQ